MSKDLRIQKRKAATFKFNFGNTLIPLCHPVKFTFLVRVLSLNQVDPIKLCEPNLLYSSIKKDAGVFQKGACRLCVMLQCRLNKDRGIVKVR